MTRIQVQQKAPSSRLYRCSVPSRRSAFWLLATLHDTVGRPITAAKMQCLVL